MNLRDLKYIVAVADEMSFSRAARRCGVSQPAMSMQIKKLEESLEVIIFDRAERRIKCTHVGSVLVRKAREILREINIFYEIAQNNETGVLAHKKLTVKVSQNDKLHIENSDHGLC